MLASGVGCQLSIIPEMRGNYIRLSFYPVAFVLEGSSSECVEMRWMGKDCWHSKWLIPDCKQPSSKISLIRLLPAIYWSPPHLHVCAHGQG